MGESKTGGEGGKIWSFMRCRTCQSALHKLTKDQSHYSDQKRKSIGGVIGSGCFKTGRDEIGPEILLGAYKGKPACRMMVDP